MPMPISQNEAFTGILKKNPNAPAIARNAPNITNIFLVKNQLNPKKIKAIGITATTKTINSNNTGT